MRTQSIFHKNRLFGDIPQSIKKNKTTYWLVRDGVSKSFCIFASDNYNGYGIKV